LSMPNQAATDAAMMNGTQMKPAFCTQICVVTPPSVWFCALPPKIHSAPP